MFLCAIDLNIGIFVDFSHIVLLYQLCVSSSRRHNDTQQTCFVKCKDIFSDKDFFETFYHFLCSASFAAWLCVPVWVWGEKKVQLSVLCPCLPPSLLLADNTWQQIFWTLSYFDLINRLNSTQSGQIMLVTHVCIRQQTPCQVLPAIHSLWEGLSQYK